MKELIILAHMLEDMVEMVAVGVRDEDLTIVGSGYEFDDLFHALGVELVKDVVEKQQRRRAGCSLLQERKLSLADEIIGGEQVSFSSFSREDLLELIG